MQAEQMFSQPNHGQKIVVTIWKTMLCSGFFWVPGESVMNTKSNKIFHLLAFSSVMCLSAGHAIASTPALQISNERWTPPSPPGESAAAADESQPPALVVSNDVWQPPASLLTKPGAVVKKAEGQWSAVATPASANAVEPAASPASKANQQALEDLRKNTVLVPVKIRAAEQASADAQAAHDLQNRIDSLASQNADLQAKLKTASETPEKSAEDKVAIEALQSQIDSLARQNIELESKLKDAAQQKPVEPAIVTSPTADQNAQVLKTMQDQIDTLARGNLDLQEKLKNASTRPEPVIATVSGPAVRQKEMDGHVVTTQKSYMRADFRSNSNEARQAAAIAPASGTPQQDVTPLPEESLVSARTVKPVIAAKPTFAEEETESPGFTVEIEKLKNRYRQSEAENAKLGDMVKVVKDQCEQEKNQMQSMLFDPQIADEQQRAYISDLEQQLGEAQAALAEQKRSYELKLRLIKNGKSAKTRTES
jgi:hypothetical protein